MVLQSLMGTCIFVIVLFHAVVGDYINEDDFLFKFSLLLSFFRISSLQVI